MVSVRYVATFCSAGVLPNDLFSRPSHPQKQSSQDLLSFFLYVSYLGSLDWFPVTSVTTIRQSRVSTRATTPLSIFSNLSNLSSGDSTSIQDCIYYSDNRGDHKDSCRTSFYYLPCDTTS